MGRLSPFQRSFAARFEGPQAGEERLELVMRQARRALVPDVFDRVALQAEARDQPAVVELGLVERRASEELLGDVGAGGLPDAVERVEGAAIARVDVGDRVDAVADLVVEGAVVERGTVPTRC